MAKIDIVPFVKPYSPWTDSSELPQWQSLIPEFQRPVFDKLISDLDEIEQIISVTGPRRVGKSTLLQQIVRHLIKVGTDPQHVIYYSFDDPALFRKQISGGEVIESLMEHMCNVGAPAYLLLDEIQTLDRWELYLKKYYDLKYPVRVIVSGSASSPIFKKSRESLLGRVKDYHVLPFSFREFLMYQLREQSAMLEEIERIHQSGAIAMGMFAKSPKHLKTQSVEVTTVSSALWDECEKCLQQYLVDGGFPEVWRLPSAEKKIEYLYDNQVKKVIFEDLVLATEFRKPEQLKTFYISLLERPGAEVNIAKLSQDIGVNAQQIDKYLPLLEMTDLIAHAAKFRKSPMRVRQGNRKYYLVDLALRNAVLRIGNELLANETMLGLYAENLVFNALRKMPGALSIDFYRDAQPKTEVDFVVHTQHTKYLPVEVKYTSSLSDEDIIGLERFAQHYECHVPLLVTKKRENFGPSLSKGQRQFFMLPLIHFLLLFD